MNTPRPEFARGVSPEPTQTLPAKWEHLKHGVVLFQHHPSRREPDPILSIGKWAENRGLSGKGHVFRVWKPDDRSPTQLYAWALNPDFYGGFPRSGGLPPQACYYFRSTQALIRWKKADYEMVNLPPQVRWHVLVDLWHPNGTRAQGYLLVIDNNG